MNNLKDMHDFSQQVNLYLDNELQGDDQRRFLSQVDQDHSCANILNKERKFRSFIKSNVHKSHVSASLIHNIKERIRLAQ